MLLCASVAWMQLVSNAHAHITLTLLIYYSTFLFFYFREIKGYDNGSSFTGGYKQGNRNGKGEEEWEDGSREIAYYVDNNIEGAAKYYDKNGNEQDIFYKNGYRVIK